VLMAGVPTITLPKAAKAAGRTREIAITTMG
jgi:hypothetical protein